MRKIYSLVLMAAALLVGTNAWAQTNGKVKIVRTGVEYNRLQLAFDAAQDGDLLELTDHMTELMDSAAWFGEPTSGTLENFASTDRSITLDLKGYTYNIEGTALYKIALTRGVLTIQSTGGKGNIVSNNNGIAVYGTYLKIDAKKTPFAHLMIKENVKITSNEKTVVLNTPVTPYEVKTASWNWKTYPLDYNCDIFPVSQHGISNGARIDVYGELVGKKYAVQVSGNIRSSREFVNKDGTYRTDKGNFPQYHLNSGTTLYLPGTTTTGKTQSGSVYYETEHSNNDDYVLTWEDDSLYSSYVHIHSSAILTTNNPKSTNATAFYSAGYARCYIEGTCKGSTGVYVKGGEVELHDAQISSNYENPYKGANGSINSGVDAGGSGVVVESTKGWTGNMEVTVSGDTYVEGSTGYAIDESVTSSPTTKVDIINIEGGTFVGGSEGTVTISETTVIANQQDPEDVQIIIAGGNMTNGTTTIGTQDLETFLGSQDNNTHVTTVTVDGKTTMVVSEGAAPTSKETRTTWNNIVSGVNGIVGYADSIKTIKPDSIVNAKWTGIGDPNDPAFESSLIGYGYITSGETVKLGELQMISGTSATDQQVLRINSGATLDVRHLMMNDFAQIIVEAGGKLIVEGTQGIVAPSVNNIILKTSETAQAIFLFNPAVTSNRHPKATVEFISKSYTNAQTAGNFVKQRFGIPTIGAVDTVYATGVVDDDYVGFQQYNYTSKQWELVGWLNHSTTSSKLKPADLNKPFISYMTQSFRTSSEDPTIITMTGSLVGNDDVDITLAENAWIALSNSYTSDMYIKEMIDALPASVVQKAVYVSYTAGPGALTWTGYSASDYNGVLSERTDGMPQIDSLRPMQPFIIMNLGVATSFATNYNDMVWNPVFPSPSAPAPARTPKHFNNLTTAVVVLTDANGNYDRVRMISANEFTTDFDGEYDIIKYMNEAINIYVSADDKMETMTTDNLVNTYLGVAVNEAGNYTMSFNNIKGENLALIDLENNSVINMAKGNTYQFYAEGTNDYRFKIVARQEMPTDVETIDENVTMKAGGIYTLTGQYLGEMNIWNTLPNGLYIVNGEKKVK